MGISENNDIVHFSTPTPGSQNSSIFYQGSNLTNILFSSKQNQLIKEIWFGQSLYPLWHFGYFVIFVFSSNLVSKVDLLKTGVGALVMSVEVLWGSVTETIFSTLVGKQT